MPKELLARIAGIGSHGLNEARRNLAILMRGAGYSKPEALREPMLARVQQTMLDENPSHMWSIPPRERTLQHYFDFARRHPATLSWLSEQIPVQRTLPDEEDPETEPRWLSVEIGNFAGIPPTVERPEIGLAVTAWESMQEGATAQGTNPRAFYMTAIEHCAAVIKCTPQALLDQKFWMDALDTNPEVIRYFPRALLTREIADATLEADPDLLGAIAPDVYPITHWIEVIGERLEDDNQEAFQDLDASILREVSLALIEQVPRNILAFNHCHRMADLRDPGAPRTQVFAQISEEANRLAVTLEPALYTQIDPALRTASVSLAAVQADASLIEQVPQGLREALRTQVAAARTS